MRKAAFLIREIVSGGRPYSQGMGLRLRPQLSSGPQVHEEFVGTGDCGFFFGGWTTARHLVRVKKKDKGISPQET
jgi:hypothetical protein